MYEISASILAADHSNLQKDIKQFEENEGDSIHIDIMDGHYVDNLTFGPKTVSDISQNTNLPIDVHFEMYQQEKFIETFIKAGASMITLQYETCDHPLNSIKRVKSYGAKVSLAFSPMTNINMIKYFIHELDQINIMTVEPGFGGQTLRREVFYKIKLIKEVIEEKGLSTVITVDGGINKGNVKELFDLGVRNFVIGSYLFQNGNLVKNINTIKNKINLGGIK